MSRWLHWLRLPRLPCWPRWLRLPRLPVAVGCGILLWQYVCWMGAIPPFILPPPGAVAQALWRYREQILRDAGITGVEILLGLGIGVSVGSAIAFLLATVRTTRSWLMPLLIASQAIPVFAIAPLLVLWLGYGMASKVAMAALVTFFPLTSAFYDGLNRTDRGWVDLAQSLQARPLTVLLYLRLPAALPAFGSGLRVAAAIAPIGAVIGEWVGASAGLGRLMLYANGRLQTDLMVACLLVLTVMAVLLHRAADYLVRRLTPWAPSTLAASHR